ncbi:DNA repair protein rad2 [Coemansia spiralis]|uniref:DNA repair protein rad2 n=2 Tax=Coemansia TaxID=4863 RepID=A0A9W8KXF9_9FUNG|nr:DNA repair protein rad2 [Coemansia umbellata]KAJ2624770.1 DNA repair protein rad2 [Coemansia sp. RSA 1358]KAJ2678313.1 DNA repair protein rad2 [Coemansia spiralis]
MGVKGLWTLLEPAARPVRLESLAHKRLAIDASIWLYQLLKAMKDAEGNPMEDAHIIGFYRRICKLLFYNIKPVFVFDGGAPELKRVTIAERQALRDTKAKDAKHAAHQLLQTQLKLHALGGNGSPSPARAQKLIGNSASPSPTKKRKRDEYELPPLQRDALATRIENKHELRMAHPDDLRQLVSLVTQYPESFGGTGDIDAIDTESEAFKLLSAEDQHDIIVALKVQSRQTSHNRLQNMLQTSETAMDFSKQQIDFLVKRNNLTQQWLQVTGNAHRTTSLAPPGSNAQVAASGRVAAERNRQYLLIKGDDPAGGWTLKTGADSTDHQSNTIDIKPENQDKSYPIILDSSSTGSPDSKSRGSNGAEDDDDNSVEFEDVQPSLPHEYQEYGADIGDKNINYNANSDFIADRENIESNYSSELHEQVPGRYEQITPRRSEIDSIEAMSVSPSSVASYEENSSDVEIYPGAEDIYSGYECQSQDELRQKQEREEQAIIALPADEFLAMWIRAVSQQVATHDYTIHTSMRRWLLEDDINELQLHLWHVNRQLEKQPDILEAASNTDNNIDSETNGHSTAAAASTKEMDMVRAKLSYLALVSSYITFAIRWRQHRENSDILLGNDSGYEQVVKAEYGGTYAKNVPDAAFSRPITKASYDVVSVASDSGTETSDKGIDLQSSRLLVHNEQSTLESMDYTSTYVTGNVPVTVDLTESDADEHIFADVVNRKMHHDAIFEKAQHLGMEVSDANDFDNNSNRILVEADTNILQPHNIDSGSEDSVDEDFLPAASSTIYTNAYSADKDKEVASLQTNNDDDDEEEDLDTTANKRKELLRDELNEYSRFLDQLKAGAEDPAATPALASMTDGAMRAELQSELQLLRARVQDNKRDASGVEGDMIEDIRMLLTLFGIPYITAPMEAEAQCAALISANLVDGIVTDDSDAFLFTPEHVKKTSVYRHFFQKDKYVEMYSSEAIYRDSSLTQRDYIFLAYLLGSDYTVGIKGIGPVLAMEALAEFGPSAESSDSNSNDGSDAGSGNGASCKAKAEDEEQHVLDSLRKFKRWCDAVSDVLPGIELPKELVSTARRRRLAQAIRKALVSDSFPDSRVAHAYFHPQVDRSDANFVWGFPNLDLLRQFLGEKLGWSAEKTDETLVPLARKMVDSGKSAESGGQRQRQTTLDGAFARAAPIDAEVIGISRHSERVGRAISSHKTRVKRKSAA